jgi:signal peptidase I
MHTKVGTKLISRFSKIVFLALLLWLFFRSFMIQLFSIPSDSMLPALTVGSKIVVAKWHYGARMPFTPLSIPNSDQFLDWIKLPYWRLPAITDFKRNDIVVFNLPFEINSPIDFRQVNVKRLIGIAGDSIQIKSDFVFILHQSLSNVSSYSNTNNISPLDTFFQADVFPHHGSIKWNQHNFGPLYLPKKGDTIKLNRMNILLYESAIRHENDNALKISHDSVFINQKYTHSYTFKMNYYFVLGDNRSASVDSRYWGLLPEDHIIGKVIMTF